MQGRMAVVSRSVFGVTAEDIARDEIRLPDTIKNLVAFFARTDCATETKAKANKGWHRPDNYCGSYARQSVGKLQNPPSRHGGFATGDGSYENECDSYFFADA